jgi:hypothetical protein
MKSNGFLCKIFVLFISGAILVLLPGCWIKQHKLVPSESNQGIRKEKPKEVSKKFVRSVKLYDEWQTTAGFDLLFFSGDALEKYSQIYSCRRGLDENEMSDQLSNKIEKDNEDLIFYVLADIRSKKNSSLSDENSYWKFHLKGPNEEKIAPESILEVELEPEIQELFGNCAKPDEIRFKIPYLVKFPSGSIAENIKTGHEFTMSIDSVRQKYNLNWYNDKKPIEKKNRKHKHPSKVIAQKTNGRKNKTGAINEDFHWV